jgi:peptidoglycan/xylan/chitin deacetylase (PgdA/CDA1 family)
LKTISNIKYLFFKPELKCLVLNYHGIIEKNTAGHIERNFHLLKSFKEHINLFHKKYNIISLQELYYNLHNDHKITNSVVLTFDDGYQNNLLAKEVIDSINPKIPFSIFITSNIINSDTESIWTVNLSLLLLKGKIPQIEFLSVNYSLGTEEKKMLTFNTIRNALKKMPATERKTQFQLILNQFQPDSLQELLYDYPQFKLLTWEECRQLNNSNVELEAHGFDHELLHTNQEIQITENEIVWSKQKIEKELQKVVSSYAYPNGDFSDEAIRNLKSTNFKMAFTTKPGFVELKESFFVINRLTPPNNYSSLYNQLKSIQ